MRIVSKVISHTKPEAIQVFNDGYYYNYEITPEYRLNPETREQETLYTYVPVYIEGTPNWEAALEETIRQYYSKEETQKLMDSYLGFKSGVNSNELDVESYMGYWEVYRQVREQVRIDFQVYDDEEIAELIDGLYISDRASMDFLREIINRVDIPLDKVRNFYSIYPKWLMGVNVPKGHIIKHKGKLYRKITDSKSNESPEVDSINYEKVKDEWQYIYDGKLLIAYIDESEAPPTELSRYKTIEFTPKSKEVVELYTENNFNAEVLLVPEDRFVITRIDGPLGTQTPPSTSYVKVDPILIEGNKYYGFRLAKNSGTGTHLRIFIEAK